jgi:hypothetical protein
MAHSLSMLTTLLPQFIRLDLILCRQWRGGMQLLQLEAVRLGRVA